ncbi:hypothetical protein M3Y94_00416700 [Aphelenchoides besseyi]|nr:hypothetical protein M3Y94_00416700 [Aphelenchoides besseyi]
MVSLRFRRLKFDFSAATVDGQPLISAFFVLDYCAFDMESSLVFFSDILSRHFVARGVANFEQSTVVIRQSTVISFQGELFDSRFVPKSYPANLEDGVILEVLLQKGNEYFVIKLDDQTQLQATKINWLSNRTLATVDEEFVYSLRWKFTDDESQPKKKNTLSYANDHLELASCLRIQRSIGKLLLNWSLYMVVELETNFLVTQEMTQQTTPQSSR